VNLLGDHVDYNEGFVLPMAIDRAMWIALRPRADRQVILSSLDVGDTQRVDLDAIPAIAASGDPRAPGGASSASALRDKHEWISYVQGVAWALEDAGYPLHGWEGVMSGDIPIGAGLSSSAALELAVACAFHTVSGFVWDPLEMAQLAQRAENEWVGVQCGIMDQAVVAAGETQHAFLLDCRSLEHRSVPLPSECAVVILDTATRRDLVNSAYNLRRLECVAAARLLRVRALRDVSQAMLDTRGFVLDPLSRRRVQHVVTENVRTIAAADALVHNDVQAFGRLMNESHASLRDDFNVSRHELDVMVDLAQRHPSCYGARMTGAGFGGCAVALVASSGIESFVDDVTAAYSAAVDRSPLVYVCMAAAGASSSG
jgi:galactokinase